MKFTNEQIEQWALRHGIDLSDIDVRAAFEDAATTAPTPAEIPAFGELILRDYFAAMSLTGIQTPDSDGSRYVSFEGMAEAAYKLADAMLKARLP